VPDELTDALAPRSTGAAPEPPVTDPPVPPPVVAPPSADGRRPSRPSWLRAALWSLVVLVAGGALGAAGYSAERSAGFPMPVAERTGDGWLIDARGGHELTGLGLDGTRLIWQDGASIEYMDLDRGGLLLLGPGPGMHTTWDPAVGDRYAVWFEAERQASVAAQGVVYDTQTGRRWMRQDIGSVYSYPAVSADLAVWSSAMDLGEPAIWGVRIVGGEPAFQVASGYGAPVVSGGLVVWASSLAGPFTAKELATGSSWRVADGLSNGRVTGLALSGRTLVWGQSGEGERTGVVVACGVDGGPMRTLASGVSGLSGPSYDGGTAVWGEKTASGGRVMARRLGAASAFVVAEVSGTVKEVAVSGGRVAWIEHDASRYSIVVRSLPR
jgi:hypothetical protein